MINPLDVAWLALALGALVVVLFFLPPFLKGCLVMLETLLALVAGMHAARDRITVLIGERDALARDLEQSRARVAELEALVGADADALAQALADVKAEGEALAAAVAG